MGLTELRSAIAGSANPERAKILQRFFKTGKGDYGEGDIFAGISNPAARKIAKQNLDLTLDNIRSLLNSEIHEERFIALMILNELFKKGNEGKKREIFNLYLKSKSRVNNWDLVDLSAPNIIGEYLLNRNKTHLFKLALSKNIWERRIAILSTFTFIRNKKYSTALDLIEILLEDKEDLIHKAAGWMLREIGKRDIQTEEEFLIAHYKKMPRTMLRYAIEKFPESKRQKYLTGKVKMQNSSAG